MVNIDLKTNEYESSAYESKMDFTLIILVLLCLLFIGSAVGLHFWKKSLSENIASVNKNIEDELVNLSRQDTKDIMDFQKRLKVANEVVDRENMLLMSFEEIEKSIIPDVYMKSAKYTKDGLQISIVAKDFISLAKQLASFKQSGKFSENIGVGQAVLNSDERVETELTLKFN